MRNRSRKKPLDIGDGLKELQKSTRTRITKIFAAQGSEFDRAKKKFAEGRDSPILVLLADLSGSTKSSAEKPVDAFIDTLRHHFALGVSAREVTKIPRGAFCSEVIKTVGDEVILSFWLAERVRIAKSREAYADLVRRVVVASLEASGTLAERSIRTKIGIHLCTEYVRALEAAEAIQVDGWPNPRRYFRRADLLGHHMNVAARLVGAAKPGNVLLSKQVADCVEPGAWGVIVLSDPLHFQGWRGLEGAEPTEKVAFAAGREKAPLYEWPYHCVAYVVKQGRAKDLREVFSSRALSPNLVEVAAVDLEGYAYRERGRLKRVWQKAEVYGLVRAVADSFDSYNTAMETEVYAKSRVLTYSSALFLSTDSIGKVQEKSIVKSRTRQPLLHADWQSSSLGAKVVALLLRTGAFGSSKRVLARLLGEPPPRRVEKHLRLLTGEIVEAALLYGEWDVYLKFTTKKHNATREELKAFAFALVKDAEEQGDLKAGRDSLARFFLGRDLVPGKYDPRTSRKVVETMG